MQAGLKRVLQPHALLALAATLLLSACAGMNHAPAAKAGGPVRLGLKLAPASLGQSLSLQQHLIVEREGRTDELDTALEIDPDRLTLVGLAFGQRVMTLQYDGKELTTWRHFMLPPQVRGEDVLEDLELTLWPAEPLRAALPPGWDLNDAKRDDAPGRRRTLSFEGQPITVIDYQDAQRWGSKVVLNNLRYHYRLTIVTASGSSAQ